MPIRTTRWHRLNRLLHSDQVVAHNLIVISGTMGAGAIGVAFQSLVSHRLQPADYGAVFAMVSLITLIGLPASAFTLLMARETSRDRASGRQAQSAALLGRGSRALLLAGTVVAVVLLTASPLIARFIEVPVQLVIATAAGIPFGLVLPLLLGEFQGEERFVAFSLLSVGQAGLKLLSAILLGAIWGPLGIVAGISAASAVVYFVAIRLLKRKLSIKPRLPWLRPAAGYLVVVIPSTLALAVLLSADVLLVKHFFPIQAAGEYAAVAALGRAIFWGATGVTRGDWAPFIRFSFIVGRLRGTFLRGRCALPALVRRGNDSIGRRGGSNCDTPITRQARLSRSSAASYHHGALPGRPVS